MLRFLDRKGKVEIVLTPAFIAFCSSFSPMQSSSMSSLFEGHQLALECLVPNLLKLYVDIEFTGSHTQVCLVKSASEHLCLLIV